MTKIARITGGQQGIGLGIATALVNEGYRVALAAELSAHSPAVISALRQLGDSACYFQHDLQDIPHIPALLNAVEAEIGRVTTHVSNAGVPAKTRGDMLDILPGNYDFVMDVNLRGAFFLAQAVARRMLAVESDHYRSITFVTSVSAALASMMAQLFAVRLAPHGIGCFELRSGIIGGWRLVHPSASGQTSMKNPPCRRRW